MKAFLSYSSKDASFVRQVSAALGSCQCEHDERTFEYTLTVQAIRQALSRCGVYVFFLSANSIASNFVSEEQRSALEARGKGLIKRVLIFALDATSYKQLPEWLREVNIVQTLSSAKACARRIQSTLIALDAETYERNEIYLGREDEEKLLRRALSGAPADAPVAIHVVGHHGIGRRTFLARTLRNLFPRIEAFIPITLDAFQGPEELYRELYALHKVACLEEMTSDFDAFAKSTLQEQVELIKDILCGMEEQGEFVCVVDEGGGVYDEVGDYHEHLKLLLAALSTHKSPMICYIQNRMMPFSLRQTYKKAFHIGLRQLSDEQTKELLGFSLKQSGVDFTAQHLEDICEHLDGHPFNVRFARQFIETYGIDSIVADPTELIDWKRRRADDFLKRVEFGELETDIIAVLSDYRHVATDMLVGVIGSDPAAVARALRRLEEFCCVERREAYFHIAGPIREAVRRDKRFQKSDGWKRAVGKAICDVLGEYRNEDHISVPVLESAALAAVRDGTAPGFLSSIILPSHLLRVARDHYDNGKGALCIEFCNRAYQMKDRLTPDAQIEVLRLWALSAVRANDVPTFNNVIQRLKGYHRPPAKRVTLFLEGFQLRIAGRLELAEEKFLAAWNLSRQNQSINRELASLYCKQRRYNEAEVHARSAYDVAPTNPYIIDILAETLLGKTQFGFPVDRLEVSRLLHELKIYGDAPGSSFFLVREAQRKLREKDYKGALVSIDRAIDRTPTLLAAHFIRADVHLALNDVLAAERDVKHINEMLTQMGGYSGGDEAQLTELEVRILVEKRQYRMAKTKIEKSAFLTDPVARRLLAHLARSIGFAPEGADATLRQWAKSFNSGENARHSGRQRVVR
jgi:tetratricopeptide (TPR) repeat protein